MGLDIQQINQVIQWVKDAGQLALANQKTLKTELKADKTPVTDVELVIEKYLIEKIHESFPHDSILAEEGGITPGTDRVTWLIDPIDGTKPYILGLPTWGISVAVYAQGQIISGFFYMPVTDELYWGWESGAFMNNVRLSSLKDMPFTSTTHFLAVSSNTHRLYDITYPRLHSYGSSSAHFAYLARGMAIGVLTRRVNLWDFAAFLPIFSHLGISINYLSGNQINLVELLDGQKTPEGILAAPTQWVSALKECISPKKEAPVSTDR